MRMGMKAIFAGLAFFAAAMLVAAPVAEFTTQPSGVSVYVNGERRGAAIPTLQLSDLRPGETYRLRFDMPGYESAYRFFTMENRNTSTVVALSPEKGLLLVSSEPEGASITDESGNRLGQTPRLVTSLDAKDPHTLTLSKTGYQDARIRIAFDGRRPQIQKVALSVDSGTVEVTTEPAGASITINGVDFGRTPVKAEGVARGRAVISARMEGYRPLTKEVDIAAGYNVPVSFELTAIPGRMTLSSFPEGARFYLEDSPYPTKKNEPLGSDPVIVCDGLKPGAYRVRAEMKGYAALQRTIQIVPGADLKEEFRLKNIMGAVEFVTRPAGATIYVDGRKVGETVSTNPMASVSDAFIVRNLLAGEHDVRVVMHGHAAWTGYVTVNASETVQQQVRLAKVFTPDLRVYLSDETIEGVLVRDDGLTLTIEVQPDPKRATTINRIIPNDRILRREAIFAQ